MNVVISGDTHKRTNYVDCLPNIYILLYLITVLWAGIAQSVQKLAMGWTVRGSNPSGGGARFSVSLQTDPGAYPASCTIGTGPFPGIKRPGRGVGAIDHPPQSRKEVKERTDL
jgi:hypothetical protein